MPLYELVAISRTERTLVSNLLKQFSLQVIHRGGVVRSLNNMQKRDLPYRMKSQQEFHTEGQYFSILFDCGVNEIIHLNRQLKLDPRVIRATIVKVGVTLDQVSQLPHTYLECLGFPHQSKPFFQNQRLSEVHDSDLKPFPGTEWEWLSSASKLSGEHARGLLQEIRAQPNLDTTCSPEAAAISSPAADTSSADTSSPAADTSSTSNDTSFTSNDTSSTTTDTSIV